MKKHVKVSSEISFRFEKHIYYFTNKMKRFFILFLFFILSYVNTTMAQNNCEQNIKQAEELYNNGDYENCIQVLEKSIKECNLSNKKEEGVLELLAKSYLEQDNLVQADATVQRLLENNAHYELKETDTHEDFDILVKKFDTHPLFSLGISNAWMFPKFKISKTYFILENVDYNAPYKTAESILLYYIWAEYEFKENFALSLDVINFNISYDREFSKSDGWSMSHHEKLTFVEIPFCFKKYFQINKSILPYASIGIGYLRMLKANATSRITFWNEDFFTGNQTPDRKDNENADVIDMRNKNNYEWLAGIGIGYKLKNLGIFIDAKYCGGLNSLTNAETRFSNKTLTNDYFYIDNPVKINKYQLGISISYTLKKSVRKVR